MSLVLSDADRLQSIQTYIFGLEIKFFSSGLMNYSTILSDMKIFYIFEKGPFAFPTYKLYFGLNKLIMYFSIFIFIYYARGGRTIII